MTRVGVWLVCLGLAACGGRPAADQPQLSSASTSAPQPSADDWFVERASVVGLDFVHFNGMSGEFYFPEVMPPGVGFLDYDNDGDLDVYLVQGQMLGPGKTVAQSLIKPRSLPLRGRLYRNDLAASGGTAALKFTDVTQQSGVDAREYGMGVAVGDINNDGWPDLYLTNFGRNQLFINKGNGTFEDISQRSGTDHAGFSVSAAFVDYDRDGRLDLFVGNYVDYTVATDQQCTNITGGRGYCPPRVYRGVPDRVYRNTGNGRFTDVTTKVLVGGHFGPALGVSVADLNDDGWDDIYVANDGHDNQLWMNQRDGTFKNAALLAGVALTADGQAEASMGVDAGDFDNDGDEDLFMTELTGEGSNLYVNNGSAEFDDRSAASGLGPASLEFTGFGTAWFDFDNDGWLDVLSVNGLVQAPQGRETEVFPLDQRKLLFRNTGNGRFEDVSRQAGAAFTISEVGRGAAFGDVDNDGDVDVLVGNDAGPVRLLINNRGNRKHWLGLRLVGKQSPRDMLGARVDVIRSGQPLLRRRARADGSYASANDPRVLVGLGDSTEAPTLRVRWPGGALEEWPRVPIDRWTTIREGTGR